MIRQLGRNIKNSIIQARISDISEQVKLTHLTYLSYQKIINLEDCIRDISRNNVPGSLIEAGVALGGSAIIIASLKPQDREFHGYDVFEMIPPPSEKDDERAKARYEVIRDGKSQGIDGDTYYGYIDNLYGQVIKNFNQFGLVVDGKNIALHKGLFEKTMRFQSSEKIAFAHIDCDWYEPVYFCLKTIYPLLSSGGYILLDDYHDYGGCKKAVDEFLSDHKRLFVVENRGNLVLKCQ